MFYFVNEIRAWTKSRREIICWEGYSVKDKIILCSFSLSSYYNTIPFNTFGVVLRFKKAEKPAFNKARWNVYICDDIQVCN